MDPDLPLLTLDHGPWRVAVVDPRPCPDRLGVRYCHGGWPFAWWRDGRRLTRRCRDVWDPYDGDGLPEVFETGLGRDAVADGEAFLRIGVGRIRREGLGWQQGQGTLVEPASWTVTRDGAAAIHMEAADRLSVGDRRWGWHLRRTVRLHDDGLEVRTWMALTVPWCDPIVWFAHPFIAQSRGDGTRIRLPPGALPPRGFAVDGDGWARRDPARGFGAVTGVWGREATVDLALDPAEGGGRLRIAVDRPLDKLVLFATERACSPEPFWARAWHDGEEAEWTVRYRWLP